MSKKVEELAEKVNALSPNDKAIVVGINNILRKQDETTDIFHWANQIDGIKKELDIELFLFNKNFTPYSVDFSSDLNTQIKPIFLYDLINGVLLGAGTGLSVRDIEYDDSSENILNRTDLDKIGRADTLLHLIENYRNDIVPFSSEEHEFKRIKGIVARFTHPTDKSIKFYAIKQIQQSKVVAGGVAWELNDNKFAPMQSDVSLAMPSDNQVLVVNNDIFIFNPSKFASMFNYDSRKIAEADKKGAAIDKHFKLSFSSVLIPEVSLLARERPVLLKKLLAIDTDNLMSQSQVMDTIDEMQIELMTDDAGAIIFMDSNDLGIFLDIIGDNYVRSVAGNSYLAKSKKALDVGDER